jgi:drug/metabolite transporter (DMT)-like permease
MSGSGSTQHAPMRAWLPSLMVTALGWGSSFLFIKIALESFTPAQIGFGRLWVGGLVLLAIVAFSRRWPRLTWKQVGAIAVVGVAMSGAPMVLIPMAEQDITSILASLLNASTPLWTALFVALLIPAERTTRVQLIGLLVGAAGIAVLVGAWDVREFSLRGTLLMLTATACYGIGGTLSRMLLARVSTGPAALSMTQVCLSAVLLAPVAALSGSPSEGAFSLSGSALWALLALGVIGTSFAYIMFWKVVKLAGATTATSVTFLVPIVATVLGIAVLGESLQWYEPIGALVVFVGVWLAGRSRSTRPPPTAATPPGAPSVDVA